MRSRQVLSRLRSFASGWACRRKPAEAVKAQERSIIPLGRRGEPDDVASWIVAFAMPSASWITGQVLGVDGGFVLV